jgi:hypothetical protein
MNYKGVKYHKIGQSTIIFYEIDNHVDNDTFLLERMFVLVDIIKIEKPKFLIINRVGSIIRSENEMPEIIDKIIFKNFTDNGIEKIFIIESEEETKHSPFKYKRDNVYKLPTMTEVFHKSA